MKKVFLAGVVFSLLVWSSGCAKKAVKVEPPAKSAPVVEQVEAPAPMTEKSEDELFQQKNIADLNREGVLKRINFDFDKYQIREDMKFLLQANADWLLKYGTVEILIEGHCDERGTEEYNIALGEKRAETAKSYLVSLGVRSVRIRTVSYGKSRPLVSGTDEASYFQNRRAEFVIVKK